MLVAREQAAARRLRPELPASYGDAEVCIRALQRLCDSGHSGVVASDNGRALAVMTAAVRDSRAIGRYARLPAEGFAVNPDLTDPTGVLATLYGQFAPRLIAGGAPRHYLLHAALPRLHEALSNLGFGRDGVYGIQPVAPRRTSSTVTVRVAGAADLDTIARLALVEILHRATPPMFAAPDNPPHTDLVAHHRALHDSGAVHLLAALDGRDVGLLTIELTSPEPRLCPDGQSYIGPTATLPGARRRGVGQAVVAAAHTWADAHGYRWISVDFAAADPLSRPFWLNAGFQPTGYGLIRLIDPAPAEAEPPPTTGQTR